MDLEKIEVGDTIAIRTGRPSWDGSPTITLELHTVTDVTKRQFKTLYGTFRKIDGMAIGTGKSYFAFVPTQADLDQHAHEIENRKRWLHAATKLNDLIGKPMHTLSLSTAQIEALADAWEKIKNLGEEA